MLARPLAIHQDPCGGYACRPAYCIRDLERLCRQVLNSHLRAGARKNGELPGSQPMSDADYDDALAFLIETGWEVAQDFRVEDDGRGTNKLAGWTVWVLHRRIVDYRRKRYGSTRYGGPRPEVISFDPQAHEVASFDELPSDSNGRYLDRERLSPWTADALAVFE